MARSASLLRPIPARLSSYIRKCRGPERIAFSITPLRILLQMHTTLYDSMIARRTGSSESLIHLTLSPPTNLPQCHCLNAEVGD
jgi:hypothetical protein